MFRNVGGLQNAGIAYDKCSLKPYFFGDTCSASAHTETPRGPISFDWKKEGNRFAAEIVLPDCTEAFLHLPGCTPVKVQSGHIEIAL